MYPYIKQQNGKKLLMVDDKPFIMLAGEVHNFNSSSVEYMEEVYDQADRLGTVLLRRSPAPSISGIPTSLWTMTAECISIGAVPQ